MARTNQTIFAFYQSGMPTAGYQTALAATAITVHLGGRYLPGAVIVSTSIVSDTDNPVDGSTVNGTKEFMDAVQDASNWAALLSPSEVINSLFSGDRLAYRNFMNSLRDSMHIN